MTQRTVDAVKQAAADNNLQGGVVSDPEALQALLDDMAAAINNNATDTTRAWIQSGGYKIQSGSYSITTSAAAGTYNATVVFPTAFSTGTPVMFANTRSSLPDVLSPATCDANALTQGIVYVKQNDAIARTVSGYWLAVGN